MKVLKKTVLKFSLFLIFVSIFLALFLVGGNNSFIVFADENSAKQNFPIELKEDISLQGYQYERVYSETGGVETYELPINAEYVNYLSTKLYSNNTNIESLARDVVNPFEITTIIDSGLPDEQSIVVVFMGDGYTAGEGKNQQGAWPNPVSGSFLYQAYEATQTLIETHPFDVFSHLFKVYAIQVVSNDVGITGAPDGTGASKDTYFETYFKQASSIDMPDTQRIRALDLANSITDNVAMVQVIANTNAHGGVSFWASYSDTTTVRLALTATQSNSNSHWNPAWHGTIIHEFGHSFGQLMDEHDTSVGRTELRANATQESNPSTVKWSHWIGYEGITLRSVTGGWYVPAESDKCIMRASWANSEFCSVCASELTRRLALHSEEVFYGKHSNPGPNTPTIMIPEDSTRILPYAFNGNTSLQSLTISSSVETIGDYAFLGATGLTRIINESSNPQVLNNSVFAGIDKSKITVIIPMGKTQEYRNAGWEEFNIVEWKTEIVGGTVTILGLLGEIPDYYIEIPSIIGGKNVTSIGTDAFADQTQITSITLPNTITSIGVNAFSGCTSLTSINIPANITSIGDGAFAGCSSLTNITIPVGVTSIGEGAFAGCSNLNISVNTSNPNYSAQGNILCNKAKTKIIGSGDIAPNITIPNTVIEVGESAFSGNSNLQRVDIYGTPVIDDFAFYDCENLEEVYFYSYIVPEIGAGAFSDNAFTVYVPYNKQSTYMTEFAGYTNNISSIPIEVTFYVDGDEYDVLATYYGANIVGVENPFKQGYTFNYWIDTDDNVYQNGDVWDSTVDLTVEADWSAIQNYINFAGYGAEDLEPILVTYDEAIGTLPTPDLEGYTFIGWRDEYGLYYTASTIWRKISSITLRSDFENVDESYDTLYYIDLDQQGGEGGSEFVRAAANAPMPAATAPNERVGYTFKGYYTGQNGTGVKYYNADMSSAKNCGTDVEILYAWWEAKRVKVIFNQNGGQGGSSEVWAIYDLIMPTDGLVAPTRLGYTFEGYYDDENKQYYVGPNMSSDVVWDKLETVTLNAKWIKNYYDITLHLDYMEYNNTISIGYEDTVVADDYTKYVFNRVGYDFKGFYSGRNGTGTKYFDYKITYYLSEYRYELVSLNKTWNQASDGILYAHWEIIDEDYTYQIIITNADEDPKYYSIRMKHGTDVTITAPTIDGYIFEQMWINEVYYTTSPQTIKNVQLKRNLGYGIDNNEYTKPCSMWYPGAGYPEVNYGGLFMMYQKKPEEESCVAAGALITLADGRQVPVETLTGNEMLLAWNLYTGSFDTAPILFIDHDAAAMYKIINLQFSDGTRVKVIYEHAFWDFNLNKYVFIREDAAQYVGHWFNKQTTDANGNMIWTRVQLTNVTITEEYTTAWSPVTYGHLCIYVNGMLSMPGATEGLINIFEVDGNTMQIDQEQYLADIATYGLFTYEEFAEIYPIPEMIFEAFGGEYLKISIGKGLIDYETLGELIERYSEFFE